MEFWIFLILGICCVVATRVIIYCSGVEEISKLKSGKQLLLIVLAILAINFVGGVVVGSFCGFCLGENGQIVKSSDELVEVELIILSIVLKVILGLIATVLTYVTGYYILGLYHFDKKHFQIYFIIVFLASILLWTSEAVKYDSNIITNTETVVVAESERELIQFEGIFVQKELNQNDTDSKNTDIENAKKDLTGDDKVSYWYINKKGEGQYNSVSAKSCKIKLISNNESPYVKTVKKCKQTTTTNNNNGKESTEKEKEWKEYYFYVPESIFK